MRVVSFHEFAAMPAGTIYSRYRPTVCEDLERKGDTIYHDGVPKDFFTATLIAACWNGDPPTVDDIEYRWGLYDYDATFAVYEPDDIATLGRMLGFLPDTTPTDKATRE